MNEETVGLSVILCTWNNADRLRISLNAISECNIPSGLAWELIVVNNACSDHTDKVVHSFDKRLPICLVHEKTPGLSHARNAGLTVASGKLVLFTDDDVRPYSNWISVYWDAFERFPTGHYFGGGLESEFEVKPIDESDLIGAPWSVAGMSWGNSEKRGGNLRFASANWACPKSAIVSVGGFNSEYGIVGGSSKIRVGEESELMNRIRNNGFTPLYLPGARIRHFVPASKMGTKHIAARSRANGYYNAIVDAGVGADEGPTIVGVPLRRLKVLVKLIMSYLKDKAANRDGRSNYVKIHKTIGAMKAYRDMAVSKKENSNM